MRTSLVFLVLTAALLVACSDKNAPQPTPTVDASTVTVAAPPVPATPTPVPTLLPIVVTPPLGLRAVEVSTGRNVTLPVDFGRASAWSRDSAHVAVAGAGLAVG